MKSKKLTAVFLVMSLLFSLFLGGCSSAETSSDTPKTTEEYEEQIRQLEEEIENLRTELAKYVPEAATENADASETGSITILPQEGDASAVSENEAAEGEAPSEQAAPGTGSGEEKTQIVVFGDSIWDSSRDESGIGYLVAQYMNADVYNCSIGGTRATLKDGESPDNYEAWDSTSLSGMVNVATGKVDPERFLEGYVAGGVVRETDFSKTDYFIIAYGLNDYFSAAPLNVEGGASWDAHGYGGALRFAIDRLRTSYPDAQILLISPTYCQFWKNGSMYDDSNMKDFGGGTLTDYANVCRNVAETQGTLYIDAYSTMGIDIYSAEQYLEDGIHLTAAGRELYAKAVSSCLKYGEPGQVSGNSVYY